MAIAVRVETPGRDFSVSVGAQLSWTVADVKAKLHEISGIPAQQQRLVLPEGTRSTAIAHHKASLNDLELLSGIRGPGVDALHFHLVPYCASQKEWCERVAWRPAVLAEAPLAVRSDRAVAHAAVAAAGEALQHTAEELRGDRAVVRAAVAQKGAAFVYASKELRQDRDFVLEMLAINAGALEAIKDSDLLQDSDFMLDAICINPIAYSYAPPFLKKDRDFLLKMVQRRGDALHLLSPELCDDELVQSASGGLDLERRECDAVAEAFGAVPGCTDRSLLLAAQRDGLEVACEELDDEEVVLAAVRQDVQAMRSASKRLRTKRSFVLEAAKRSANADIVKHVSVRLRTDATFMDLLRRVACGEEVSSEEADTISRGLHEDQQFTRYLLSEII